MELVALWGLCREALTFSQGRFFPYGAATPIRTACLPPIHLLRMLKTLPAEFLACESPLPCFPVSTHFSALFLFHSFPWEFWREKSLIEGRAVLNQILKIFNG